MHVDMKGWLLIDMSIIIVLSNDASILSHMHVILLINFKWKCRLNEMTLDRC